jgi:uncharacterized protein involved in exopolysaccharide biosynthesis
VEIETEKARLAQAERELAKQAPTPTVGRSPFSAETLAGVGERGLGDERAFSSLVDALAYEAAAARMRIAALERERQQLLREGDGTKEYLSQLEALYRKEEQLRQLEAEYDLAQDVYSDFSRKSREAKAERAARTPWLSVVDPATPPSRESSPRLLLYALTAAALGLTVSLLLATVLPTSGAPRSNAY